MRSLVPPERGSETFVFLAELLVFLAQLLILSSELFVFLSEVFEFLFKVGKMCEDIFFGRLRGRHEQARRMVSELETIPQKYTCLPAASVYCASCATPTRGYRNRSGAKHVRFLKRCYSAPTSHEYHVFTNRVCIANAIFLYLLRESKCMDNNARMSTSYDFLEDILSNHNAGAYLHIGDRYDDNLRYLTRFNGPDSDYAFIYIDGDSILCSPRLYDDQAKREFPGNIVKEYHHSGKQLEDRIQEILNEYNVKDDILIPRQTAAEYYETLLNQGNIITFTDCTKKARRKKDKQEIERIETVTNVALKAMATAESVLATAEIQTEIVSYNDESLTTGQLRKIINSTLAEHGVNDAGNTVIGVGSTCTDLHYNEDILIRPNKTILIDISPRGPSGYYSDVTRTFVIGHPSGEVMEAYEAVKKAQDEVLDQLGSTDQITYINLHDIAKQTFENEGFETKEDIGFYHKVGHGVGVSLHERPFVKKSVSLEPGDVITIEPGLYNPEWGGIRLENLVVVEEGDYQNLTPYRRTLSPQNRSI